MVPPCLSHHPSLLFLLKDPPDELLKRWAKDEAGRDDRFDQSIAIDAEATIRCVGREVVDMVSHAVDFECGAPLCNFGDDKC